MVVSVVIVCVCLSVIFFFFFKQKTAYELRISDWSSDVCSSDLPGILVVRYEDLLADPLDQFGRLARHFGISTDAARIRKAVEFSSFNQLQKLELTEGFVERSIHSERFFRAGQIGRAHV